MRKHHAEASYRTSSIYLIAILVASLCTGCAIADKVSGVSEARDLQANGIEAEATILEIWNTGTRVNHDPVVGFLLEVRPKDKPAYRAKTKLLIQELDIPRVQPGTVVAVRIDPRDPNRVALDIYDYNPGKKKKEVI